MSGNSTPEWIDPAQRVALRSCMGVFGKLRDIDGDMAIQQMVVLFHVALHEGCTQRDMSSALNMPTSTASRNIAALSTVHRLGKEGLGLVTWVDDPLDRRTKLLCLTPKGRAFMLRLTESLV